jgi:pyridoxal/pyridoxine/pyridoxamine kinase
MALTYLDPEMIEQPIDLLNADNIVTTTMAVSSLSADFIKYNYTITETVCAAQKIFSNNDSSKAFHFDTGGYGDIITAVLSSGLTDGFNITILNIDSTKNLGSNTINLSSDVNIITPNYSTSNTFTNTGMLIYKHNNEFYGVGTFD